MSDSPYRLEHARRMHRVLEYIDQHLDGSLDLHALSGVAHFSPFHFHRLFTAWIGESLGGYVRRRRLEVAAMRMAAQPRVPILHIALSVGFGSAEAFSRAFKRRFDASPSVWREDQARNSKMDQVSVFALTHNEISHEFSAEVSMNVQMVERYPVPVVYLRHDGPYGEGISDFWTHEVVPWMMRHDLAGSARFGISHDAPGITESGKRRYDACVEVPADFVPPPPSFKTVIPGGRYAVHRFEGAVPQLLDAWTVMLRDWLPGSGLQLDDRPAFEHFPVGRMQDASTGVFACEICVPVAPQ